MTTKTARLLVGCAVAALLAGGSYLPAYGEDTEVGTPREATLIVDQLDGPVGNPQFMNPFQPGISWHEGVNNLVMSPLWDTNSQTGKTIPMAAASLPEPLDKTFTKFRIHLREGLKWSDGQPFTADDVIFTAKMLTDHPELANRSIVPELFKTVTKVDDHTLDVETSKPTPRFVTQVGSLIWGNAFRVIPEHIWKDKDPTTFTNFPPVVLGAYSLDKFDPNGNWTLWHRRSDWQSSDLGAAVGMPNPEFVLFRNYGTEEKRVLAMAQNKLDILMDITADSFQTLVGMNDKVRGWWKGFPYGTFDDPCARGMHFNTTQAPYDAWQTRWALALATDIVDVSLNTYSGMSRLAALQAPPVASVTEAYYKPMESWLQDFALRDGYKPFDKDVAAKIVDRLKEQGISDLPTTPEDVTSAFGIGWWKYDPAEATKLLESVGFSKDSNGHWLLPDKTPWHISIDAPADFEVLSRRLALATAESWKKFGLDVDVNLMQSTGFNTALASGTFTVASSWAPNACAGASDLSISMDNLHKEFVPAKATDPAPNNPERYTTPEITALIDKIRAVPSDDPSVVANWTQVLKDLLSDMPVINEVGTTKFVPTNNKYWTNYPTAENAYEGPWWWWSQFKEMLTQIKPAAQ